MMMMVANDIIVIMMMIVSIVMMIIIIIIMRFISPPFPFHYPFSSFNFLPLQPPKINMSPKKGTISKGILIFQLPTIDFQGIYVI